MLVLCLQYLWNQLVCSCLGGLNLRSIVLEVFIFNSSVAVVFRVNRSWRSSSSGSSSSTAVSLWSSGSIGLGGLRLWGLNLGGLWGLRLGGLLLEGMGLGGLHLGGRCLRGLLQTRWFHLLAIVPHPQRRDLL